MGLIRRCLACRQSHLCPWHRAAADTDFCCNRSIPYNDCASCRKDFRAIAKRLVQDE